MPNPGTPAHGLPPAEDDAQRRQADLKRRQREDAAARTLEAAQIGAGGLTVTGGFIDLKAGSTLHVSGDAVFDGTITLPSGSLDTPGGSISAGVDITAGRDVIAGRNIGAVQDISAGRDITATVDIVAGGDITAIGDLAGDNLALTGDITSVGTITAAGNAGISGQLAANGPVFFPDAFATLITGTRVGAWWGSDGRAGYQPSTRDSKTNDSPAELNIEGILGLQLRRYQYKAEIQKRDGPAPYASWQGPNYEVATELGLFAEDLCDADLNEFVFFHSVGGVKKPIGIHYENFSLAVLAVAQSLDTRLRVVEAALGIQAGS